MPIPITPGASHRRSALIPWVVLSVAAGLSIAAWWLAGREVKRTAQARFDHLTERMESMIRLRFDTTAQLLHGAAAFPSASDEVTAADWSVFLRKVSARLGNGAVGIGYVERVPRKGVAALEARLHAQGEAGFKVEGEGQNEWLYVVVGIEPREHNTGVLGLDIGAGTTRRTAAEEAADRNELILSRRIRLRYDGQEVPGFLLFLPVYRKGTVIETREQRLAAVQGWVYAPIRIDHLMTGVAESVAQQIDFEVFEDDGKLPDTLLYDYDDHPGDRSDRQVAARSFQALRPLEIYGRRWTLRLSTLPEFDKAGFNFLPAAVLGGGLGFSVLAALLTWALVNARRRALKLAHGMTADLRRLALLASRTSNGVMLADPEWRVEWINDGFTRLFGYTLEEIKGRQPGSFMPGPESDPKTLAAMARAAERREPFMGEVLQYTKAGRKVWVEVEIQPVINEQGGLEGFMGLQLDITDRHRHAEEMGEAVETAERASQAKSQFLAVMSHEIRTPMNGVIGMSSLLLDTPLTPEQRESAETIRKSGEALLAIINDILDYSKIESGRLELEQTEFMLGQCCEAAVNQLTAAAAQKKLELRYEGAPDLPAMVAGDAQRLQQVLQILLGNAVKFTERGRVVLTVKVKSRENAMVEILLQVRDTGIGIPVQGRERLFKPFSQVDASLTRKYEGIGLGLAICRRLVELMGGSISVESEPGQGSTFSVALRLAEVAAGESATPSHASPVRFQPRKPVAVKPAKPAPPQPAEPAPLRILVAEDNPVNQKVTLHQMRSLGYEAEVVADGSEVLAALRRQSYDVVFLDLFMPVMDGMEAARRIRDDLPKETQPWLVALTANAMPGDREACLAGGMDDYLSKPLLQSDLAAALVRARLRLPG